MFNTEKEKDKIQGIESLNIGITKNENSVKRTAPQVYRVEKERVCPVDQAGMPMQIMDYKALKIIIDGVEIKEMDFGKLFPTKYTAFNIKLEQNYKTKEAEAKVYKSFYIYFPKEMLQSHSIQVIYRQKMREYTYTFSLEEAQ